MTERMLADIQTSVFDFTGGRLCLDFVNTLRDRTEQTPRELLKCYDDLVVWGVQAQILPLAAGQRLLEVAEQRPAEATAALQQAMQLREAIYRVLQATIVETSPAAADLALLNTALASAMSRARLVPQEHSYVWDWMPADDVLERMLWDVARSAADVLTSSELHMVRVCAADDCNWLFLDTSKNQSRRWCSMKGCGNRSKVRKHYERKKQEVHASDEGSASER